MRLFETANYEFMNRRRVGYVISSIVIAISLLSLVFRGIETGIDFQGGTEFVISTGEPISTADIRSTLTQALGSEPEVKQFGDAQTVLIRTVATGEVDSLQALVTGAIAAGYPQATLRMEKVDSVGPRFADDLRRGALYAVFGSLLVIFLYILVRFEWRFSVGAVVTLAHDVTIVLGMFSLFAGVFPFSLQIDQAIIAAFLTIVGYSLNDTVVIFDRIREYSNIFKTEAYDRVVNRSINQTLSRTVVTSGTTLLVVLVLFLFGGEVLKGFAFALVLGVMVGTYSSIFVASPIVVELHERSKRGRAKAATVPVRA
ncbi:protein translocase subunit SecF [soil metagenome]